MYPGMMHWLRNARRHGGGWGEGAGEACGPHGGRGWHDYPGHGHGEGWHAGRHDHGHDEQDLGGGAFGVRRPLRFLAYRLELDEAQVAELARILDALKVERAQAEVDRRRTVASFADALAGEAFDAVKAGEGGQLRVKSAEQLREAVLQAL